jgi:hypothetical protein
MCAGYGTDALRLIRLKKVKNITCIEKDDAQFNIGKEMVKFTKQDCLAGINGRVRYIKCDAREPSMLYKTNLRPESFDTVICSYGIHHLLEGKGLENLTNPLKIGGRLVLLFMDGGKLEPSHMEAADATHENCYCQSSGESSEEVHCLDHDVGFHYKHQKMEPNIDLSKFPSTHIWIQRPNIPQVYLEAIVKIPDLQQMLLNHGLERSFQQSFLEICERDEFAKLADIFTVMVFTKHSRKPLISSPFLRIDADTFGIILEFLVAVEIFELARVHSSMTQMCWKYMDRKTEVWQQCEKDREDRLCGYYSYS